MVNILLDQTIPTKRDIRRLTYYLTLICLCAWIMPWWDHSFNELSNICYFMPLLKSALRKTILLSVWRWNVGSRRLIVSSVNRDYYFKIAKILNNISGICLSVLVCTSYAFQVIKLSLLPSISKCRQIDDKLQINQCHNYKTWWWSSTVTVRVC